MKLMAKITMVAAFAAFLNSSGAALADEVCPKTRRRT